MQDESDRHYLVSPVASGLARLFLLEQVVSSADENELSSRLRTELEKQLRFLREKLQETQHRIDAKLASISSSKTEET